MDDNNKKDDDLQGGIHDLMDDFDLDEVQAREVDNLQDREGSADDLEDIVSQVVDEL